MRLLWALSAALVLSLSLALVLVEPDSARAQDVTTAQTKAEQAERRAAEAASILSQAQSRRAGLEDELVASLTRLSELGAELSRVSVRADELRLSVVSADSELARINETLTVQAVDAYVRAVTVSAANVVGTDTAESAIVAAASLESAIGEDRTEMANLTVQRRQLDELRQAYVNEQEQVVALQSEVEEETEHLESLLAEADSDLAAAAAAAREADAEYRAALDAVDLARARQQEKQRQDERRPTGPDTPAAAVETSPTTTATSSGANPPPTTAPPVTSPPTTPTPPPVSGGPFSPSVERWRDLVAKYFPAQRVDAALTVLGCESNGDPAAYNPYSGASGLFQFLPSTWATVSPGAGFAGASVFDPEANIGTAAWLSSYYESRGSNPWSPWTCRP